MRLRTSNDEEKLFQILRQGKFTETNCFEWSGPKDKDGYGIHTYKSSEKKGRTWKVHRLIWMLLKGEIPEKILICHACDNPTCFNINHLYLGTHSDNCKDRERKGRGNVRKVGEENPRSTLTECIVLQIRKEYASGKRVGELAIIFGVAQPTITKIVHRQRWVHI